MDIYGCRMIAFHFGRTDQQEVSAVQFFYGLLRSIAPFASRLSNSSGTRPNPLSP